MASKRVFRLAAPLGAAAAALTLGAAEYPVATANGYFNAVAETSATNAWAVGLAGPGPGIVGPTTPLIEHWNGAAWS
jgi:hypothetical protein